MLFERYLSDVEAEAVGMFDLLRSGAAPTFASFEDEVDATVGSAASFIASLATLKALVARCTRFAGGSCIVYRVKAGLYFRQSRSPARFCAP